MTGAAPRRGWDLNLPGAAESAPKPQKWCRNNLVRKEPEKESWWISCGCQNGAFSCFDKAFYICLFLFSQWPKNCVFISAPSITLDLRSFNANASLRITPSGWTSEPRNLTHELNGKSCLMFMAEHMINICFDGGYKRSLIGRATLTLFYGKKIWYQPNWALLSQSPSGESVPKKTWYDETNSPLISRSIRYPPLKKKTMLNIAKHLFQAP